MIPTYPLILTFKKLNCLFSPFASLSVLEEMADIVVDNDMDMERWWLTKRPPRQFRICKASDSARATYIFKGLNSIQGGEGTKICKSFVNQFCSFASTFCLLLFLTLFKVFIQQQQRKQKYLISDFLKSVLLQMLSIPPKQ